jgi:hypothetical protein
MVERPPTMNQKQTMNNEHRGTSMRKTTSLMAIAVAVAMVGGVSTITSLMTIQQAEAARCPVGVTGAIGNACFCYNTGTSGGFACYRNNAQCERAQSSDPLATSECSRTPQQVR